MKAILNNYLFLLSNIGKEGDQDLILVKLLNFLSAGLSCTSLRFCDLLNARLRWKLD